jgi:dihydrolipoamide dehydrogenase
MRLTIVGAGPGGYVASIKAAQLGAEVVVIEDTEVGGTCLNSGCIPTKSLLSTSEMLFKTKKLHEFGIELKGEVYPNISKIMERKNRIVNTQVKGIRSLFKSWGITLKEGRGTLLSPREIEISLKDGSREVLKSDKIIIATGSRPSGIPEMTFDGEKIISSNDAIRMTHIPKSLLIVGAGVIGCEFACIYNEFGTDVSIVEALPRVVATEDFEISELLEKEFKKKNIKLYKDVKIKKLDIRKNGIYAVLNDGKEIFAEKVLVAVGRDFNSDGIGIEKIGINKGTRGEIMVNQKMETNIPGIYAVGDVVGGMLLAHVASREGIIAAKNIMGGEEHIDYTAVPNVIYTLPEIASVGLREHQAEERGIKVKTGYFQFRSLAKAHIIGEITGFLKIVSEERSDRILGVHIIGPHASDLIHEATLAIRKGLKTNDITETIHAHPTLSEGLKEAAEDVYGEAIHIAKK